MTAPSSQLSLVLGFHPTAHGFGWVLFENPLKLVAHGVYEPRGSAKNAGCIKKLRWLLALYLPETVVIEAFDKDDSQRSDRIRALCLAAMSAATEHNAELDRLTRSDVSRAFEGVGARTREEIAEAVARHLPALTPRLPKRRKAWVGEDKRLSVFCAAALVIAHYHNGATALLNDLRNAA